MFKVILDSVNILNEPIGLNEFNDVLERDNAIRGLLFKYPNKLTFWGDGYTLLNDMMEAGNYCPLVPVVIQYKAVESDSWEDYLDGVIRLTACKRNLNKRTIECPIDDNNYGAKIYNNKSSKAKLDVSKSKNGVTITACPSFQLEFFDPTTGVYDGVNDKTAYDIQDAFRFIIDFMTDGTVGFVSDWMTNLPDTERLSILRGIAIRSLITVNAPEISFEDLLREVNKKYNVGFGVEKDVSGNPVIRIEEDSYFYQSAPLFTIEDIEDLEVYFEPELLYSKVKIGSNTTAVYDSTIHSLSPVRFLGFKNEEYVVQGECNIDKALDLVSDWIIDSNIIEDIFTNQSEEWDDDIVIVQYTESTSRATKGFYLTGGALPALYNEQLLNTKVAARWKVQDDIVAFLSNTDPSFKAVATTSTTMVLTQTIAADTESPFKFDDDYTDGHDVNNVYGNGTTQGNPVTANDSRFTAIDAGYYTFELFQQGIEATLTSASSDPISSATYEFIVYRYSSSSVFIETISTGELPINLPTPFPYISPRNTFPDPFIFGFNLDAGDYVYTDTVVTRTGTGPSYTLTLRFLVGGYFRCISSSSAGGIFQTGESGEYKALVFKFNKKLSNAQWALLNANPSGSITINHKGSTTNKTAWVRMIKRTKATTDAEFELRSNINNGS